MTNQAAAASDRPLDIHAPLWSLDPDRLRKLIAGRSFATLSTTSENDRSHAAGVVYILVGDQIYLSTQRFTRKARNVAVNRHVAVAIPVRRLPFFPPSLIHFQGAAELLDPTDPSVAGLVADGSLKKITHLGELDLPEACMIRIVPTGRIHTYGLGMSLLRFARNPLDASGISRLA